MTASTAEVLTLHQWAVAVDTALSQFWGAQQDARGQLASTLDSVHYALDERAVYRSKHNRSWPTTGPEAEALLREKLASGGIKSWEVSSVERMLAKIDSLRVELVAIAEAKEPFEAEFEELHWSRFFLVRNNGGHIHSSMACSTCFPTTLFGWLPELSGLTEKEAVEAHGTILCSICFPSAPVEWTLGKQRDTSNDCALSGQSITQVFGSWEAAKPHFRYSGVGGYIVGACPGGCGQRGVAVTSTYKVRKHRKKETS